ncbi:MAG: nucleotide exchange factor GrpE [Burkholderiaceae bacterium]
MSGGWDDADKERLVEQFRAGLALIDGEPDDGDEAVDLATLLAEMAVLKNEVRLQARQFKAALEELQGLGEALREQNERLQRELDGARAQSASVRAQAERSLLLGLLELRDRLQAGLDAAEAWRPSSLQRLLGGEQRFARSLREGSALTLQRLDELLASHRVRAIEAVGRPLDPQHMHAVAAEDSPGADPGVVLRELRRGFFQGNELLRAAEVIVNRRAQAS